MSVTKKAISWVYTLLPAGLLAGAVLPFVDWGFSDDDIFITAYLVGEPFPAPIWPHNGRYFPLGHQEWRLLPWAREAWVFHLVAVLQYAAFCLLLRDALWSLGVRTLSAFFFVVSLPPVVVTFAHIVVPDRNQLLLWAFWLAAYLRWDAHRSILLGLLAILCAGASLYYKEPTFLFYSGFALVQIFPQALQSTGFPVILRRNWCNIGILLSCGMFLAMYSRKMAFATLTSSNAYNGHTLDPFKILPTAKQTVLTEPLLVPLLLCGLLLSVLQRHRHQGFATITQGLWLGAFLYATTIIASGLVGKYYYALPLAVFAVAALARVMELFPRQELAPYLGFLVVLNTVLWIPPVLYKHDWTTRNREMVSAILERAPAGEPKQVVVGQANAWDAAMLILYAKGIRNADITFFCPTANMGIDWLGDFCPALTDSRKPRMEVKLGQLYSERHGNLLIDSKPVWKYASIWDTYVPAVARTVLKDHYNFQGPL